MENQSLQCRATELEALNVRIAEEEQRGDEPSITFFEALLADDLIFRRASGTVVGKKEFLEGLKPDGPYSSRDGRDIEVYPSAERALVTLIVETTKRADGSKQRFRNIRLFVCRRGSWRLEFWYNYEITGS